MNLSTIVSYNLLPWQWVAWICMGICIGLSKTGFIGITAVTIPIMALIFGARESTGLILPLLCLADLMAVIYYHSHAEWKYIIRLLPWALVGFGAALLTNQLVPVQAFKYLIGGCILVGTVVMIWNDLRAKDQPPPSAWWFSALFGIAGGFSTMIGNIAGPIMTVFLLSMRLPKNNFVGTSAWFFLILNYLKLPIQILVWKNITAQTLLFGLTLVPVVIASVILGIYLISKISEPIYRKAVIVLTLISTVFLFI